MYNLKLETEKLILQVLEDQEFKKDYPFFWLELLKILPHSYTIHYDFKSIQEAKEILALETHMERQDDLQRNSLK